MSKKSLNAILEEFDLTMIEYQNSKNIIVKDSYGYKYKLILSNMQNRNKLPHLFRGNPFAVENIRTYLFINNTNLILLSDKYVNCKQKLEVLCTKHLDKGVQYKSLDDIVSGSYCKYCGIEKRGKIFRISDASIKKRCEELGLIYVDRYVKNKGTWVKFKCPKHLSKGTQEAAWDHFRNCSLGCVYCAGRYKTTEDFICEMHEINQNIEIIGTYSGSENPVKCKCKICGHEWSPIGRSLKCGQGCPACTSSKGEIAIRQFLNNHDIKFVSEKTFDDCFYLEKLRFDFFLTNTNILIEYDGEQHFTPVDFANKGLEWANKNFELNKIKDCIKDDYCENNNLKLIRIPYWEYNNIEEILTSELSDVFLLN